MVQRTAWTCLAAFFVVLAPALAAGQDADADSASSTLPQVDIYLFELSWEDGRPSLDGAPANATNRAGYDNQPAFTPDGHGFYYTAGTSDGQTDIFRCAIPCDRPERITDTPGEGEFSPRPTPDGRHISYIHQPVGGYGGQVWIDAPGGGVGEAADPRGPFGYYAWNHDQSRLAVFALADPFRLDVFGVEGDTTRTTVAEGIGRALYASPDHRAVYFTAPQPDSSLGLYRAGFAGEEPELRFGLPAGSQDYVVLAHPGGGDAFLAVDGGTLVYRAPEGVWEPVGDLAAHGLEGSTRLAISADLRRLAVVAADGATAP